MRTPAQYAEDITRAAEDNAHLLALITEALTAAYTERDEARATATLWESRANAKRVDYINRLADDLGAARDEAQAEVARLRETLERIANCAGKTQLADCCVTKTCTGHYEGGERVSYCAFQYGVARGFNECASDAKEALSGNVPAGGVK